MKDIGKINIIIALKVIGNWLPQRKAWVGPSLIFSPKIGKKNNSFFATLAPLLRIFHKKYAYLLGLLFQKVQVIGHFYSRHVAH